jgi:hypothetical protein
MSQPRPNSAAPNTKNNSRPSSRNNNTSKQHNQTSSSSSSAFPFRGVDEQGRPYVQPTHGMGARGGKALNGGATYENLGGRLLLRLEHEEHLKRLQKVKPSIDSTAPKSFEERKRQQRIQQARFANHYEHQQNNNQQQEGEGEEFSIGNSNAEKGSVGRLRSATNQNRNQNNNNVSSSSLAASSPGTPSRRREAEVNSIYTKKQSSSKSPVFLSSTSSSSQNNNNNSSLHLLHEKHTPTHDVYSQLHPDAQMICKNAVGLLETLSASDSRALLTQLLREAEEKRLLHAYSGVFPSMQNDSSSVHHHQKQNNSHRQHGRNGVDDEDDDKHREL